MTEWEKAAGITDADSGKHQGKSGDHSTVLLRLWG